MIDQMANACIRLKVDIVHISLEVFNINLMSFKNVNKRFKDNGITLV